MKKTIYDKKWEVTKEYLRRFNEESFFNGIFVHYTSLNSMFSILESDSFWASNVRFSNDATEERMLNLEGQSNRDDYIICFCAKNDILSQWRGYCHNGGASIEFELNHTQEYSILHADYESSGQFDIYENTPLPVIYLDNSVHQEQLKDHINSDISSCGYSSEIKLEDMLPYLKNGHFREELELRMIFSNNTEMLSKCIRFRTLSDGVKVPYIVVKCGNMGKMKGACSTEPSKYNDERLKEMLLRNGNLIWITEGYDQETKYYEMMRRVDSFRKDNSWRFPIKIYCKGRLPVKKIKVAPTYDRERKAEQIRRFCQSKYWLKDVVVEVSEIPYIQPLL